LASRGAITDDGSTTVVPDPAGGGEDVLAENACALGRTATRSSDTGKILNTLSVSIMVLEST
jgi:hypothetical protein